MTHFEIDLTIRRPPQVVFNFIANFENNPTWQSGIEAAWFTSEGPLDVGSTYSQRSKFLGRELEFDFEVTRFEPGRLVAIESTSGSFPVNVVRAVEPVEEGSRVRAIIQGDAGGVFRLLSPILDWMTKRRIEADYARLKRMLELRSV